MQVQWTIVQGRRARYAVVGEGAPLILLHGWSLGCRSYRSCLTGLAGQGWRVFAPALPGFGGTADLPGELFGLDGYARWVAAFIQRVCSATGPVPLLGHSFGGGVAIRTAHDFPDQVERLIVINSIGSAQWTSRGNLVRAVGERPLWDWGLHLASDLIQPRQLSRLARVIALDLMTNLLGNPIGLWRVGQLAARTDLSVELAELKARRLPMVIVWGHGDRFLPRLALQSLREVARADCLTVDGTHTWLLTRPEVLCEVITNVLATSPCAPMANSDLLATTGSPRVVQRGRPSSDQPPALTSCDS